MDGENAQALSRCAIKTNERKSCKVHVTAKVRGFFSMAKDELPALPSPLLRLEVGPLNTARGSGERCKFP